MQRTLQIGVGVIGLFVVTQVSAEASNLSYPSERLQKCQQQNQSGARDEIRLAIKGKDLAGALARLPKPGKATSAEQRYLYGKVQYLQAYERVNLHLAEKPDAKLLDSAARHIKQAAKQGYAEAIFDQAMLLTPQTQAEQRLRLLTKAANKQFVPAMMQLAEEYFLSAQTFEKRIEAQALIQQAATLDTSAKIRLARYYLHEDKRLTNTTGYDKDIAKAMQLFYEVALSCDGRGAYWLYEMASFKYKPNSLEPASAISWLRVASELGLPRAQSDLAEYYFKIESDVEKAIQWGKRAAEHKNVKGLIVLGDIYYQGQGIDQDYAKSIQYYEQALELDHDNRHVQDQLGMMYYKGEGAAVDFHKAAEFCKVAANKGQAGCQYYLGLMYVNGEGVTQDIDRGISWMRKSAAQNFTIAKNWLRENW